MLSFGHLETERNPRGHEPAYDAVGATLKDITKSSIKYLFFAYAVNDFGATPMSQVHAQGMSEALGPYRYLRMR